MARIDFPSDCEYFLWTARAGNLVEADDGPHLRLITQSALQKAGVAEHQRGNDADALRGRAVNLRDEVQSLCERRLQFLLLKNGACAPDSIGDLVGDELARLAETGRSGNMSVNPLLGLLQL